MSDGKVRDLKREDIKIGHVVRRLSEDGEVAPFEDSLIMSEGPTDVMLARPYARVALAGSVTVVDLGVESYRVTIGALLTFFQIVLSARGEPMVYKTA